MEWEWRVGVAHTRAHTSFVLSHQASACQLQSFEGTFDVAGLFGRLCSELVLEVPVLVWQMGAMGLQWRQSNGRHGSPLFRCSKFSCD